MKRSLYKKCLHLEFPSLIQEKPEESFPNKDRPCIIYSFGVATESSFEAEFLERTDCEIWAYDASVDRMGNQVTTPHPRVHFNKVYIQPKGNATLGSLMKQVTVASQITIFFYHINSNVLWLDCRTVISGLIFSRWILNLENLTSWSKS